MQIIMHTDGAARGNPDGPGGYGVVIQYIDEDGTPHEKELSGGFEKTTNNKMELMAVIVGLEYLDEPLDVLVISDSQYVVNAFNQDWIGNWKKNGWRTASNDPVKNLDLWRRLLKAKKFHKSVRFKWQRGHCGDPFNERCDRLATAAADAFRTSS